MNRIAVEKKVLNENQILAERLRERYRENNVLCVNLISSPGSGKTALLERTLERMDKSARVAVLTAICRPRTMPPAGEILAFRLSRLRPEEPVIWTQG